MVRIPASASRRGARAGRRRPVESTSLPSVRRRNQSHPLARDDCAVNNDGHKKTKLVLLRSKRPLKTLCTKGFRPNYQTTQCNELCIVTFKGVTTATSGVLARFPWLLPVRNSFASYGASAVTRTSDRGHVAEAKDQCHRSERALNQGFQRNPSRP